MSGEQAPRDSRSSILGKLLRRMANRDLLRIRALPRYLKGRVRSWLARVTLIGFVTAIAGVGMNAWGMQEQVCSFEIMQPGLGDLCGNLGLGGKPTRAERLAWEALPEGSCAALDGFLATFRNGAFAGEATQRRQFKRELRAATPRDFTRESRGLNYARQAPLPFPTEELARASAKERALGDAREQVCARARDEEIRSVVLTSLTPQCTTIPGAGTMCGVQYHAKCTLHGRPLLEWCGPGAPK